MEVKAKAVEVIIMFGKSDNYVWPLRAILNYHIFWVLNMLHENREIQYKNCKNENKCSNIKDTWEECFFFFLAKFTLKFTCNPILQV